MERQKLNAQKWGAIRARCIGVTRRSVEVERRKIAQRIRSIVVSFDRKWECKKGILSFFSKWPSLCFNWRKNFCFAPSVIESGGLPDMIAFFFGGEGKSVHHGKTQLWNRGGEAPRGWRALTAAARQVDPDAIVQRGDPELPSEQGVKGLGTPLGYPKYVRAFLQNSSRAHRQLLERIPAGALDLDQFDLGQRVYST